MCVGPSIPKKHPPPFNQIIADVIFGLNFSSKTEPPYSTNQTDAEDWHMHMIDHLHEFAIYLSLLVLLFFCPSGIARLVEAFYTMALMFNL